MGKLLIVDDDSDVADLLKTYAEMKGIETYVARNGREGLSAYGEFNPDAVFSDYNMPGMTGVAMMIELREKGFRGPSCLFTGNRYDAEAEMRGLGIYDKRDQYFTRMVEKPLKMEAVNEVLYDFFPETMPKTAQ